VPLQNRQATIARFIAGSILGQTLGPLVGGLFTDWVGWRASFAALGAVFLVVAAILFAGTVRKWPSVAPGRFAPLAMHRRLVGRVPIRWLTGVGIAETFFFFGAFVFLGAYFKQRFDLSFTAVGLLLAGYGMGGLLYSFSVRALQRLGESGMVRAGGLLAGALFAAVMVVPHWIYALPCTIGLGFSFYLVHNTIQTRATEIAPDARGSAVSLYAAAWSMGQATGVAAMGVAVAMLPYQATIPLFGLGFCALGLWLPANLRRLRP
jgi:predicted MFS family arabinose efflux permease